MTSVARRLLPGSAALVSLALTGCATIPATTARPIAAESLPLVRHIDERYQSYQIGFSHLTGGETWRALDDIPVGGTRDFAAIREARLPTDLGNARLRMLARELAPFYVRYSGTTANSVYFHDSDTPLPDAPPPGFTVMLSRERWREALAFADAVDAKVVTSFTNSEGVRDESHAWTARMAAPLLEYTRAIGGEIHAAELFNEPNAPEPPRLPRGFTAEEFARDFAAFRQISESLAPDMRIAGPGSAMLGIAGITSIGGTSPEQYAAAEPQPEFDIVSYHFYPALGSRCAPATSPQGVAEEAARDPQFLARPDAALQQMLALREAHAPSAPVWLTETGGAACGGLDWQPSFLDMFRYLDTHARLARQGLDAIFTHALISGTNGIIDEQTFAPNASYWGAVLWRRLMGTGVLDTGTQRSGAHRYAHCLRGVPGGVALLVINYGTTPDSIEARGAADLYALSSADMLGRTVKLNGTPLTLTPDDQLPDMRPYRIDGGTIRIAPASIAFIALPEANNSACRNWRQLAPNPRRIISWPLPQ